MARIKTKLLTAAIRAPFLKRFGVKNVSATVANSLQLEDWAYDNTFEQRWRNAADTDDIRGLSVNGSNRLEISEEVYTPMRLTVPFSLATAAQISTQVFWIAPYACRIVGITEIHATAEATAPTLTGYVEKLTSTTVPGSGTSVMTGTFNLKATINTLQTATLLSTGTGDSDEPTLLLAAGDRLGFVVSAAGTELAGLQVEVALASCGNGETVTYNMKLNANLVDESFFIANRDMIVTNAFYVHSTAGTVSGCNVQLVKDTGTTAPGAGTDLLTNDGNLGFECDTTLNTVQTGALTATAASLRLAPGDRLSVDFSGTLTNLVGVVLTVVLQPVERRKEVTWHLRANAELIATADQMFFIADRNYEIICISEVHSTAGSDGSPVSLQVTRDKATDAPGAGTDLIAIGASAVGFNLKGTANTVQIAQTGYAPAGTAAVGFIDPRFNFLMAGDRLSLDFNGTLTALVGVVVTVSLRPA